MMQRLLRGRLLYLFLLLLVLFLYVRIGFIGHMAVEPAAPAQPPHASLEWWPQQLDFDAVQRMIDQKPHIAVLFSAISLLAASMAVGGVVLTLWGLLSGRVREVWRFPAKALPPWSFGEVGRVVALVVLVASLMPFVRTAIHVHEPGGSPATRLWITVSMLLLDGFAVLTILAFAQGKAASAWRAVGLGRYQRAPVTTALCSYVTAFPWLLLLLILVVEVARAFNFTPPVEPIHELIFEERRPAVFALTTLLACVVGPLAEEVFFRGVLYPALRRKTSRVVAMLVSGAVFAMIHTNLIGFLPIMLLGSLLAYLYERTGSLLAPLAVHVVHNTLLISLAVVVREMGPLAAGS